MSGFNLIIQPDEDDEEAAEVLVDGTLGGRPYRFLLDTGAARSCVLFDDYTATFDRIGQKTSSGVFASGSDDLITVPAIELGPITKQDFTLARMSGDSHERRNLIGMDFLKDNRFHFSFAENRVLVDPQDAPGAGSEVQELLLGAKFHPYVDVHYGPAQARAVWDTGAGVTVVNLEWIERNPAYFQTAGKSSGTDWTGASSDTPMFTMTGVVIGGHEFPPHQVAGVDLSHVRAGTETPMDLILGYSTLSKANWLFDFPRRQWAVTKMLTL